MKTPWFRPCGFWYQPTHLVGWILSILVFLFCVHTVRFVDRHSGSVSDTFYNSFPYVVPAILAFEFVARKTCSRRE